MWALDSPFHSFTLMKSKFSNHIYSGSVNEEVVLLLRIVFSQSPNAKGPKSPSPMLIGLSRKGESRKEQ